MPENFKWAALNYTPLHNVVRTNNWKLTKSLLKDPSVDVNARTLAGDTPLFLSLQHKVSKEIILLLIESKCDVQLADSGGVPPLSLAVKRRSPEIAHSLIKNGADVDAKDCNGYTALHEAIKASRYKAVCMLLYYNASVNEQDSLEGITPFMLSMDSSDKRIAKVLYDYVTDFDTFDHLGNSLIYVATRTNSPLRNKILFQYRENIHYCNDLAACLCLLIYEEGDELKKAANLEYFRHVILNVDHENLLQNPYLICTLFESSRFAPADFVEHLFILLSTEHAVHAIKMRSHILYELYQKSIRVVSVDDWLGFAYLVFSMGKPLHYFDFYVFYKFFGFGREFEPILSMKPPIQRHILNKHVHGIMAYNIFFGCVRTETVIHDLFDRIFDQSSSHCREELLDYLRYYTLSSRLRRKLNDKCNELPNDSQVDLKFVKTFNGRDVASLLELCRNKIRKIIAKNNHDKRGIYKTFDGINCLPVPEFLKDILHLKRPLYS